MKKILLALAGGIILIVGARGIWTYRHMQINEERATNTAVPGVATTATSTAPMPPVDETANWKTYTNEKYGFSFKYPTNLNVYGAGGKTSVFVNNGLDGPGDGWFHKPPTSDDDSILVLNDNSNERDFARYFSINIVVDETKTDWAEKLALEEKNIRVQFPKVSEYSTFLGTTTFSGVSGSSHESCNAGGCDTIMTLAKNNVLYTIETATDDLSACEVLCERAQLPESSDPNYYQNLITNSRKIRQQILSTFTFIDSISANAQKDWHTYTNSQYKFSFEYPLNSTVKIEKTIYDKYQPTPLLWVDFGFGEYGDLTIPELAHVLVYKKNDFFEKYYNKDVKKEYDRMISNYGAYQDVDRGRASIDPNEADAGPYNFKATKMRISDTPALSYCIEGVGGFERSVIFEKDGLLLRISHGVPCHNIQAMTGNGVVNFEHLLSSFRLK